MSTTTPSCRPNLDCQASLLNVACQENPPENVDWSRLHRVLVSDLCSGAMSGSSRGAQPASCHKVRHSLGFPGARRAGSKRRAYLIHLIPVLLLLSFFFIETWQWPLAFDRMSGRAMLCRSGGGVSQHWEWSECQTRAELNGQGILSRQSAEKDRPRVAVGGLRARQTVPSVLVASR